MLELDKVALPYGLSREILHGDPNYNKKNPIPVDPRLKYIDIIPQMKQNRRWPQIVQIIMAISQNIKELWPLNSLHSSTKNKH